MKYNENQKEDARLLEQKLYTVADVAELTGLTSRTIRNYLKDGTLHGKKIGVQWRFTEEDIENLFRETTTGMKEKLPEEIVNDFLRERPQEMSGCLMYHLPFSDDVELEQYRKQIEEWKQQNTGDKIAVSVLQEEKQIRVAVVGNYEMLEDMTARMRECCMK